MVIITSQRKLLLLKKNDYERNICFFKIKRKVIQKIRKKKQKNKNTKNSEILKLYFKFFVILRKKFKIMSNYSFNQPLNEGGGPPQQPRQASDFLNEFRDWWIKVPLISK